MGRKRCLLLCKQEGLGKRKWQEPRGTEGKVAERPVVGGKHAAVGLLLTAGQAEASLKARRPLVEFQACCTCVLAFWLWVVREGDRCSRKG